MSGERVECEVVRLVPGYRKRTVGAVIVFACGAEAFRPRRVNQRLPVIGSRIKCARCTYKAISRTEAPINAE